ncbi:putative ABC transport system permease protein [Nocardioides daedukensis]|uniref:Putative ABC transport system permease protein n=1 Tax=Nocardioides daedukensis TaxID=634462 RepID=A0A7Y9UNZ4_9ACTN|nr:FtsX-like permease family protein [Nocardioides daedukensis]NYG57687.1 putative ABC transport system permease protein [Nocardioides daedukensis]
MYVAWRDAVHARGRFLLMVGVVLMISVLVGLLSGLTKGLGEQSTSAITGLRTERLVFSGGTPDFASSRVPASAGIEGEPIGLATTRATADEKTTPVTAMGVRPGSSAAPDAARVAPGRIVLTAPLADELGLAEGDSVGLGTESYVVADIRGEASYSHTPVVWLALDDWTALTGADAPTVVATSDVADVPEGYTSVALGDSLRAIGAYSSENGSLQLIRAFLLAISALVVGAFFTVWTMQRAGDIAVLKALGASTSFLLRDALGQAALLLLGGVGLGALLVLALGTVVGRDVPFVLDAVTLGGPLLLLALLGMCGAALAVRRVSTVDPLTALGSAR